MPKLVACRIGLPFTLVAVVACGPSQDILSPVSEVYHHNASFLRAYKDLSQERHKRYDPVSLIALQLNEQWEFEWPEHSTGKILRATNNLGLSEDVSTDLVYEGLRVLVAGDSHTEGVVWNQESFPNVLEAIARQRGLGDIEALNAGVGYMGPYCYVGVLRKYLGLAPDVFIMTVFCGNDFMDDLRIAYLRNEFHEPAASEEYYGPLRRAEEVWPAPCWQGVNQVYRFANFADEMARSLDAVQRSIQAARVLCDEYSIRLLVVLLPTKFDVDQEDQREEFRMLAEHLGLGQGEMALNERLGNELQGRLESTGIRCVNALAHFREAEMALYWRRDHHLNVAGHSRLASLLLPELQNMGVLPQK